MLFRFEGITDNGQPASGSVEASDAKQAQARLESRGLLPTKIIQVTEDPREKAIQHLEGIQKTPNEAAMKSGEAITRQLPSPEVRQAPPMLAGPNTLKEKADNYGMQAEQAAPPPGSVFASPHSLQNRGRPQMQDLYNVAPVENTPRVEMPNDRRNYQSEQEEQQEQLDRIASKKQELELQKNYKQGKATLEDPSQKADQERERNTARYANEHAQQLYKTGIGMDKFGKQLTQAGMGEEGAKVSKAGDLAGTAARAMSGDPTAMALLAIEAKKEIEKRIEMGKQGVKEIAGAGLKESPTQAAAQAAGGMEHIGKAIGGPMGKAIENTSRFARVMFESVDTLRNFSASLHEGNMQFAEYSARMAHVQAESQVRRIFISQERGERRAEAAKDLAESRDRLDKTLAPLEDKWAKLQNRAMTWVNTKAANALENDRNFIDRNPNLMKAIGPMGWAASGLMGKDAEEKEKEQKEAEGRGDVYADKWMFDAAEAWPSEYGRPERFNWQNAANAAKRLLGR